MGHGRFTGLKVDLPQDGRAFFPADWSGDRAIFRGNSLDDGQIFSVNLPFSDHIGKDGGGEQVFGDDEKACGVPVQPVDTAVDEIFSVLLIMPGESIGQGVSVVLKRRVDESVSSFV